MKNGDTFRERRNDRTMRYAGRVLDPHRVIAITAEPDFLQRAEGQAAAIVTANLLARMTPAVVLAFSDVAMHGSFQGRRGSTLHECCLREMFGADPDASFEARTMRAGDYQLHLGSRGAAWIAHGADWNAYVGPAPSPLPAPTTENIFGATFAAITAVAKIFAEPFPREVSPNIANLFDWQARIVEVAPWSRRGEQLGNIWFAGGGSVGSAVAYFLALAGYTFDATIFDGDIVKIENLDRSPIFTMAHNKLPKSDAVTASVQSPPSLGRGGPQHKEIQQRIKECAEKLGFHVEIEKTILGGAGHVDVSLDHEGQTIACEISITTKPEDEIANYRKCIAAGYQDVLAVAPDKDRLIKIARMIQLQMQEEEASRIHLCLPSRVFSVLKRIRRSSKHSQAAAPISGGYKIKKKYSAGSDDESQAAESEFLAMIGRALRGE